MTLPALLCALHRLHVTYISLFSPALLCALHGLHITYLSSAAGIISYR